MKRNPSVTLRKIHRRALIAALRDARGNAADAARALGVPLHELNTLLDDDPAALWSTRTSTATTSGTRPRLDLPTDDEPEDGPA